MTCHSILAEQGYKVFAIDDEAASLIPYEGDAATWFQQNTGGRVMNFLAIARGEHISLVDKAVARIKAKMGLQPRVRVKASRRADPQRLPDLPAG